MFMKEEQSVVFGVLHGGRKPLLPLDCNLFI